MDDIVMHGPCDTPGCDRPAQVSTGLEDFLCVACSQKELKAREKERADEWRKMKTKRADDNEGGVIPPLTELPSFTSYVPAGSGESVATETTTLRGGDSWIVMPDMPSLPEDPPDPLLIAPDVPIVLEGLEAEQLPIDPLDLAEVNRVFYNQQDEPDQEAEDG